MISSLDPGFRAQELSFVVSQIARNVELTAAAERRSWLEQLLGRQPAGLAGPLSAAQERAGVPRRAALGLAAQQRARRRRRSASPCSSPS